MEDCKDAVAMHMENKVDYYCTPDALLRVQEWACEALRRLDRQRVALLNKLLRGALCGAVAGDLQYVGVLALVAE